VLVDNFDAVNTHKPPPQSPGATTFSLPGRSPQGRSPHGLIDYECPPPPPEDAVDPSFFEDDHNEIMPMDSIDEMDIILMEQPSQDKDNDVLSPKKLQRSFSYSPRSRTPRPQAETRTVNSLKFHLVTEDDHGGYMVSVSQKRIRHLRHILMESGVYRINGETACKAILAKVSQSARGGRQKSYSLTKDDFDSAMRDIISGSRMSVETQRSLSDVLGRIFSAFDRDHTGSVNAMEVACGFSVLCHGKKSDKLEYSFEVLDSDKKGNLSKTDTSRYLRSFLTVLLTIASTDLLDTDPSEDSMTTMNGTRCEINPTTMARAVEAGSSWAASQAFKSRRSNPDLICFDEFAEWYTHVGYSNIPWLELLDLHKWVVMES
jgi:Ca2+-binding EF-hand superfamily protein